MLFALADIRMSSFTIIGFFALAEGNRVRTTKPGSSTSVCHCHYASSIQCSHGTPINAQIRVFSPATDPHIHPDDTVVFVIGSAWMEKDRQIRILIDADHMIAMPGDPTSDDYDEKMPDFRFPIVNAVGHVLNTHHNTYENHTEVEVNVSVSDYVRGQIQHSTIQYVSYQLYVPVPSDFLSE
jgi:hypothetical protein